MSSNVRYSNVCANEVNVAQAIPTKGAKKIQGTRGDEKNVKNKDIKIHDRCDPGPETTYYSDDVYSYRGNL